MGGAVPVGDDRVARQAGPWTPAVQAWLRHLRASGVPHVPQPLGVEDGRELQGRLPGSAGWHPPHARVRTEAAIGELAAWLTASHAAAATFAPAQPQVWAVGERVLHPGEVVVHGDLGPWNTLWEADGLTGVVDWDLAEPGPAWWDLANLVWGFVPVAPLRPVTQQRPGPGEARTDGWVPDQPRRLAAFAEAVGRRPGELLTAVADWLDLQVARRTTGVPDGPLWAALAARDADVEGLRIQRSWLDGGASPFAEP